MWVKRRPTGAPSGWSAPGGEADEIGAKADVASAMSEAGGKADVPARWLESLLLAEAVEKLGQRRTMTDLAQQRNPDRVLTESFFLKRAAAQTNLARPTGQNSFSTASAISGCSGHAQGTSASAGKADLQFPMFGFGLFSSASPQGADHPGRAAKGPHLTRRRQSRP